MTNQHTGRDLNGIFRFIFGIFFLIYFLPVQSQSNEFRYPAEFEEQQAVWFGWNVGDTSIQNTVATLIKHLEDKVPLRMAISHEENLEEAINLFEEKGVDLSKIEFNMVLGDRFWIRDNGAVFLVNKKGELGVADFEWANYGYYDWMIKKMPEMAMAIKLLKNTNMISDDSMLDQRMGILSNAKVFKSQLAMEGGALETNGQGVLIQCEEVTLQRNPGWTKKEIEAEYRRLFNIQKVIWVKKGPIEDSRNFQPYLNYRFTGTGGHVDEFVRFADANTILLGWINTNDIDKHPLNKETHRRMLENFEILSKATDVTGQPFRVIKIPMPAVVELADDVEISNENDEFSYAMDNAAELKGKTKVATASYLNYVISNGIIINASYTKYGTTPEYEARVKAIFKVIFPDREQVWLDAMPINRKGGGMHCITLHEPLSTLDVLSVP